MATQQRSDEPSSRRIANSLVALSSAAILSVYAAGYLRTRSAAERFAAAAAPRRSALPAAASAPAPVVAPPPSAPSTAVTDLPAEPLPAPKPPPPSSSSNTPAAAVPSTATEPVAAPTVTEPAPPVERGQYKDGAYLGWGTSRHGDIQASVVIVGGRIVSSTIAQCLTQYPCSDIEELLPIPVKRQVATLDFVSGATESSDAFLGAVDDALYKAK